jgi:ubiquinone/menaquinone biosynthesis C-methylase UbiE
VPETLNTMTLKRKAHRGLAMEGVIASWYARNTSRDLSRFKEVARVVAERVPPGGRVLEVAPGPGYLAIEIAKSGREVASVDISQSFVKIARENANKAGITVDVRHGNASEMPFADMSFDFVVCTAAFKNFADPLGALNEIYRVLRPGGQASIYDLRTDAAGEDIHRQVHAMELSRWNELVTRWIFRFGLLKAAYTREQLERMVAQSQVRSLRDPFAGNRTRASAHEGRRTMNAGQSERVMKALAQTQRVEGKHWHNRSPLARSSGCFRTGCGSVCSSELGRA